MNIDEHSLELYESAKQDNARRHRLGDNMSYLFAFWAKFFLARSIAEKIQPQIGTAVPEKIRNIRKNVKIHTKRHLNELPELFSGVILDMGHFMVFRSRAWTLSEPLGGTIKTTPLSYLRTALDWLLRAPEERADILYKSLEHIMYGCQARRSYFREHAAK